MKIYSEGQGGAEMPVPPSGVHTATGDSVPEEKVPPEPTIDEVD